MTLKTSELIVAQPLQQSIINPNTRLPALGKIYFYVSGTEALKPIYKRSGDAENPFVVSENPIDLDASGSLPYEVYFYPIDESDHTTPQFYDVVVKDATDIIIFQRANYPLVTEATESDIPKYRNYVPNGQFSHQYEFYRSIDDKGRLRRNRTHIGGNWYYDTDANLDNYEKKITFNEITAVDVEGSPVFEVDFNFLPDPNETQSDFSVSLGNVGQFAGREITFSMQAYNNGGGNSDITIKLHRKYSNSYSDDVDIGIITLSNTREKIVRNISVDALDTNEQIDPENNELTLVISFAVQETIKINMVNVLIYSGNIDNPIYYNEPDIKQLAEIVGGNVRDTIHDVSINDAYASNVIVSEKGLDISPRLGQFVWSPIKLKGAIQLTTSRQTVRVSDYSEDNTPYSRIYEIIKNKYGGTGNLIVTSDGAIIKFSSSEGARPKSNYSAETSGFITNIVDLGLRYNLKAEKLSSNVISLESTSNFSATQLNGPVTVPYVTYHVPDGNISNNFYGEIIPVGWVHPPPPVTGNSVISTANVNTGSGSTPWKSNITFHSTVMNDYKTVVKKGSDLWKVTLISGMLCVPHVLHNTKGRYAESLASANIGTFSQVSGATVISFDVDNQGYHPKGLVSSIPIKFYTNRSLSNNLDNFVTTINTKFNITFTVNRVPNASNYFLCSSSTEDFTAWYEVDEVGTDPAIPGRTSIKISIDSSDTFAVIAKKTAQELNNAEFALPKIDDLTPIIPAPSNTFYTLNYFI